MNLFLIFIITLQAANPSGSSALNHRQAYQIFTGQKGKSIHYDKMIKRLSGADVIFFGETHNNSICHWLELQVLQSLNEEYQKNVVVGAEMFEADDQLILDEYMKGLIRENHLMNEAKIWDNYKTDYAPIVRYAKKHKLRLIATNIPRRYASLVARKGIDALDDIEPEARAYMTPLPIQVEYGQKSYTEMQGMMGGHHSSSMIDAQAIKDATMAYFISSNISSGAIFYHINGSFHSQYGEGIVSFLRESNPGLNILTISVVDQDQIDELEHEYLEIADFVIAVPSDMTRTY